MLSGYSFDYSSPWDIALLFISALTMMVIPMRYAWNPETKYWYRITFKETFLLIPVLYFSWTAVIMFAVGTANGTSLKHPVQVFFYLYGGVICIYGIESSIKYIDRNFLKRNR